MTNLPSLPTDYHYLTPSERAQVRAEYARLQGGKCHHCKAPLDGVPAFEVACLDVNEALFPKGFFLHPVHLHHNHSTGLTIGAVHNHCNAVLWQYYKE